MTDPAEARNAVAQAVDVAAALIAEHDVTSGTWPQHMHDAVEAITATLVEAGISRRRAEWATTRWIITRQDIWRCVEECDDDGPVVAKLDTESRVMLGDMTGPGTRKGRPTADRSQQRGAQS